MLTSCRTALACALVMATPALADDVEDGVEALKQGDFGGAIRHFDAALRKDPRSVEALTGRGVARAARGDLEGALADYGVAIRLDPKRAELFYLRGNVHHRKKDARRALGDFNEAVRLDPGAAAAHHARGLAHLDLGEHRRAAADFSEAIRLDPKRPLAHYNRGVARQRGGQYRDARDDFAEAAKLDPENPNPPNALAWLLATCPVAGLRDGKKAVEYGEEAWLLSGWGDVPVTLDNLAAAHAECGDFKKAARLQGAAVEIGFDDPEVQRGARERLKLFEAGKPYHGR